MIKGPIQQEDRTLANTYALNIVAPKYIGQILADRKEEIDSNTIIVVNSTTSLTSVDRSSRQRIKKRYIGFKDKLDQIDLIVICIECSIQK